MREVEIKGNWYRIESLDAMNQLYVARRIGPLLLHVARSALTGVPTELMAEAKRHAPSDARSEAAPSGGSASESAQAVDPGVQTSEAEKEVTFMKAIAMAAVIYGPFIEQLAQMKDDDLNFIIKTCLSVCRRRDGDSWAPLVSSDGRSFMYQDMKLGQMMKLTVEVIRDNLADFFELLSGAA